MSNEWSAQGYTAIRNYIIAVGWCLLVGTITTIIMVLAIVVALACLVVRRLRERFHGSTESLRAQYRSMLRMPDHMADEVIEAHLSRLRIKHPGRSEQWYLEKMLYDLERDRR